MRLFVALELPGFARDALIRWREAAVERSRALRELDRDSLHVTMCFLGWRSSADVGAIAAACEVLAGLGALRLSLADSLWLPRRQPRVLAVELDDPAGSLARAQAALSRTLAGGGWYEPERRRYLPHVTVARVARGWRAPPRALPAVSPLEFDATEVTLFQSRLDRSGATYKSLMTIELACSRRP